MSDLISRRMMLDKMISRKSLFSTNQYEYMALSEVDKARADEIDNCIADLRNAPDAEQERTAKVRPLSDLIRREDVIKILSQRAKILRGEYGDLGGACSGALKIIKEIPSAEPVERTAKAKTDDVIITVNGYRYHCEEYFCNACKKVVLEEVKWIPVREALPKDMDMLLVTIVRSDGSKRVRSGHYYKGYFMLDNGDTWNETDKEVLAWMPLVEPYTAAVANLENNE